MRGKLVGVCASFLVLVSGPARAQDVAATAGVSAVAPVEGNAGAANEAARLAAGAAESAGMEARRAAEAAEATSAAASQATTAAVQAAAAANVLREEIKEAKFEDLKAGKLIRFGVTAGVAFTVFSQSSKGTAGVQQESAAITTMPYVLMVPAYWAPLGDVTRTYCATHFGGNAAVAREAAASHARKMAAASLDAAQLRKLNEGTPAERAEMEDLIDDLAFGKPDENGVRKPVLSEGQWNLKSDGKCGWTKLGFYVGKPLSYDASVTLGRGEKQSKEQVDPYFSAGLAFVPNAYVTLLLGVTMSAVHISGKDATDDAPAVKEQIRRFVTPTFAIGGNIDLVGSLLK